MNPKKWIVLSVGLLAALLVSSAAAFAQQDTSFKDGRINGDISLGGLAIYCVDQFGQPGAPNINNGGITIWGVGGRKYVALSAGQLRGQASLLGTVPNTVVTTTQVPLLLATANTMNGPIWLFRTGNDRFALQGTDNTFKFFTYQWTNCDRGSLSTGGGPLVNLAATAQPTRSAALQSTTRSTSTAPTAVPTNAG